MHRRHAPVLELGRLMRRPLGHVAILSLVVNLLLLAPALFILQLFDRVLTSRSVDTLVLLLAGMGIALALMLALDYLRSRLQGVVGHLVADALAPTVARSMLAQLARRGGPVAAEGLRDVAALRSLFSAQGLLAVFDAPWALVYVAVIWLVHPLLGAASAAAAGLMLGLALLNDRLTRAGIEAAQSESAAATRYLESSMANAEVVQALGMGDALVARWRRRNAGAAREHGPLARRTLAMAAFTRTTRQSVQVLLQALGAYLVIVGEATAGAMVATTILLGRALAPVEQVVGSWRVLAEGRLAWRRLRELLGAAGAAPARMALPAPSGHLQADGLMYRLPNAERPLIAGLSFQLEPGEALAVLGPSGAGKSTLLRLLTGVWRPSAGAVRLDHVDLAEWRREELGPWIGYVPQGVELFAGSVAENIARLGEVDAGKVVAAAQRAHVHEMILGLPGGYDAVIDPAGALLSPGQRQRIALARALYGEPKLVVLDEPNANLDGAGEAELTKVLEQLHGQVTVVIVTHRVALTQHADHILVLEPGRPPRYGRRKDVLQQPTSPRVPAP
jgi:PrtD family type I secretion system ABC transporter